MQSSIVSKEQLVVNTKAKAQLEVNSSREAQLEVNSSRAVEIRTSIEFVLQEVLYHLLYISLKLVV